MRFVLPSTPSCASLLTAVVLLASVGILGTATAASAVANPTADVRAGHRSSPATGWLLNVKPCNRFVSKTGNDTTGTSEATAWRTITKAMQQLQAGQTACVRDGAYDEAPMVAAATGTAANPIAIKAFPGDTPVVRADQDGSLFDFQRSGQDLGYWLLEGLTIDKRQWDGAAVRIEGDRVTAGDATLVHHIAVRANTIRNGKSGAAVLIRNRVRHLLVQNNDISDHRRFELWRNYQKPGATRLRVDYADAGLPTAATQPDGSVLSYGRADAHAIDVESDSRFTAGPSVERVRIQGNTLRRNGGDGFQCIGAADGDGKEYASDAADIDLVDNWMEANAEEAVDIKSCQWVSIRGSVSPARAGTANAANNKFLTSQPTNRSRDLQVSPSSGNFGGGGLITLHWNARHVRVENTRLRNACSGIAVGRGEVSVRNLVIRRVLAFGMVSKADPRCASDSNTGTALRLDRVENADIYHNTFDMQADAATPAVQVGTSLGVADPAKGPFLANIDFWNNIVRAQRWLGLAVRVTSTSDPGDSGFAWTSNFNSDRNLYFRPGVPPPPHRDGFILILPPTHRFDALPLSRNVSPSNPANQNWQDATGQDSSSIEADPLFVDEPATNDYYTKPRSPARDGALPITGYRVPACPGSTAANSPDIGFRESCATPATGRLLFTSERDGKWEIYAMKPDGTGQTRLTNLPGWSSGPAHSPDRARIAFTSNVPGNTTQIFVMNADGSNVRQLTNLDSASAPAWSPDGTRIAFDSRDFTTFTDDIWVMNADGTNLRKLTAGQGVNANAVWSPDGTRLAFLSPDLSRRRR